MFSKLGSKVCLRRSIQLQFSSTILAPMNRGKLIIIFLFNKNIGTVVKIQKFLLGSAKN